MRMSDTIKCVKIFKKLSEISLEISFFICNFATCRITLNKNDYD